MRVNIFILLYVRDGYHCNSCEQDQAQESCSFDREQAKNNQGFIYWGVRGGIFPPKSSIFPPKTFLNNNCIKYLVYAFFALSSAVLYCISNSKA